MHILVVEFITQIDLPFSINKYPEVYRLTVALHLLCCLCSYRLSNMNNCRTYGKLFLSCCETALAIWS